MNLVKKNFWCYPDDEFGMTTLENSTMNDFFFKIAISCNDPYRIIKGEDFYVPEGIFEYDMKNQIFTQVGHPDTYLLSDVVAFSLVSLNCLGNGKYEIR